MYTIPYTKEKANEWNDFVACSDNGTFLIDRNYMDYHKDRFPDESILLYKGDQLWGLFPATKVYGVVHSHAGLTYGGLITKNARLKDMLDAVNSVRNYYATSIVWKPVPQLYRTYYDEVEESALANSGFTLVKRLPSPFMFRWDWSRIHKTKQENLRRGDKVPHTYGDSPGRLDEYWKVLEDTLFTRHNGIRPVHTLEEMRLLMDKFPANILFRYILLGDEIAAGMIVYRSRIYHIQYLASTKEGRKYNLLDKLLYYFSTSLEKDFIMEFGVSHERDGSLNEGLHTWKEWFGTHNTSYSTWSYSRAWGSQQGGTS